MNVLIIEDHAPLAANLVDYLSGAGHIVDAAPDGLTGLRLASSSSFDAIVLDLGLPGLDGIELCRRLRADANHVPILVMTARGELDDRIHGLDCGADDYLVKPVKLRELDARLRALVRRSQGRAASSVLRVGDLALDERTMQVTRQGHPLPLTRMDFRILQLLMRESPAVVTRQRLQDEIWGDAPPESDSLRSHVHRVRRVVDQPFAHPLIKTVIGVGYRLVDDDAGQR